MDDQRFSDNDVSKRDIPSFIEPLAPLIQNPYMRPRPHTGKKLFEEEELEEPELVQVYLRLKPCKLANNLYEIRSDRSLVTSLDTTTAGHGRRTQHNVTKMYTFTKIFPAESRQKEIFEVVVKDNLKKLPEGHNFTLLTYGPSGSGKTYTLMGTVGEPGLVPRSLEYVFQLVEAAQRPIYKPAENGADKLSYAEQDYELQWVRKLCQVSVPFRDRYRRMSVQLQNELTSSTFNLSNRTQYYVWVSFVEIYNEGVYDLLAPPEKRTKLRIREDSNGHVYVKGAAQAFVRSGEEAYDVMAAGKHNLRVAATGVHAHSSRSHCIFTITMLTETDGEIRPSVIRLCDLAGCERAHATRNTGARMQESRAINSSLHVLERCLHMLRRNQQRHKQDNIVPYRESKLTRLLGSGLSGARGEAVSMVVTLNPSPEYANETKHVLTLAAVAQDIQINNTIPSISSMETFNSVDNTTIESGTEYMKLKSDNERLHFELMQAQVRNRDLILMMETKQRENADIMNELVDNAKKNITQYYEMQLDALQSQMDDIKEEYEEKIAELKEELIAEKLARARVEKEIQHLRTCIEERDEKSSKEDVVTISDYENESDEEVDDPLNQSLEPVLKRDIINRSKAFDNTKEIIQDNEEDSSNDELFTNKLCQNQKEFDSCENSDDKFEFQSCISDTDKDHNERVKTINSKQREADDTMKQLTFDADRKIPNVFDNSTNESNLIKSIKSINNETTTNEFSQLTFDDEKVINNITNDKNPFNIKDTDSSLLFESHPIAKAKVMTDFTKFTYDDKKKFDTPSNDDNKETSNVENNKEIIKNIGDGSYSKTTDQFTELTFDDEQLIKDFSKKTQILEPKFIKELEPLNTNSDVDIIKDIFSKLTSEDEFSNDLPKPTVKSNSCDDNISVIQPKTSRGTYFVRECINSPSKNVNEFPSVLATRGNILIPNTENRSPKHTFDHKKYDMRKIKPDIVKTMVESFESIQEKVINVDSPCKKPTESMIVSKIVQSIKSNQGIDNSLLQFENLEIATKEFKSPDKKIGFGDIKILQDKRNVFVLEKENSKEKESESDKTGINAGLRSPVLGSTVAEIKAADNIKLYESDTIINKKSNKEVIIKSPSSQEIVNDKKGGRQQPYFDLKLDDSKTTSSVNIVTGTLSSKNNLQQIINNVNSSIDDMNSFKDKRCFGKEDNPVEKITKSLLCDNINDENIIKDNVKSNMNNNRIENDIEKNTCSEKNDHEELLPVTIKKRVFFDDDISQKIVKKEPEKDLKPSVKVEYDPKFVLKNKHNSIDIFDELSPFSNKRGLDVKKEADDSNINKIEINENKNICNVSKDITNKRDSFTDEVKLNDNMQVNDTIRAFEDIYADISVARVTDFDLLVTDTNSNGPSTSSASNLTDKKVTDIDKLNEEITPNSYNNKVSLRENDQCSKIINEKLKNNTEDKEGGTAFVENVIKNTNKTEDTQDNLAESIAEINLETNTEVPKEVENEKYPEKGKYNLRRKAFARSKAEPLNVEEDVMTFSKSFKEEFSTECSTNCEKPRRPNLRLRRRKNQDSEEIDTKLKDIVNLQTEFCDVTLDKPTTRRKVKDIPSPENESENLSPYDIQSCPSKSVTRSRRKLFTPRAEALDESEDQTGESNERIRVPRPSYHKPRARRKL